MTRKKIIEQLDSDEEKRIVCMIFIVTCALYAAYILLNHLVFLSEYEEKCPKLISFSLPITLDEWTN